MNWHSIVVEADHIRSSRMDEAKTERLLRTLKCKSARRHYTRDFGLSRKARQSSAGTRRRALPESSQG
jgi:hypothetical protein